MGDLPEPKYHTSMVESKDTTPVMTKIYSTLGRKFNRKDLEDAQKMGMELVCNMTIIIKICRGKKRKANKQKAFVLFQLLSSRL